MHGIAKGIIQRIALVFAIAATIATAADGAFAAVDGAFAATADAFAAAAGWNAEAILEAADSFRVASRQCLVRVRLTSWRGDKAVETALFDVLVGGRDRSLVIAREYRSSRMKILYSSAGMWVLLEDSKRPIRITPIQRLMGEASNGDVAETSFSGSYRAEPAGEDTILDAPCRVLELTAKHGAATYARVRLWVRSDDCRPVMANYFVVSGKHAKTAFFEDYRSVSGRPALSQMTIRDEFMKGRRTTFEYLSIVEREFPERYFNKDYLIHVTAP